MQHLGAQLWSVARKVLERDVGDLARRAREDQGHGPRPRELVGARRQRLQRQAGDGPRMRGGRRSGLIGHAR